MRLQKRTYALPSETLARFEARVGTGHRSGLVGSLMQDWLDEQERAALRREIIEGCRDMAEIDRETARDWQPLEAEVGSGDRDH